MDSRANIEEKASGYMISHGATGEKGTNLLR